MSIEICSPKVPRIVIAEAKPSPGHDGPCNYLVFSLEFDMLLVWVDCVSHLSEDRGGIAPDALNGSWNRIGFQDEQQVCIDIRGDDQMRIFSDPTASTTERFALQELCEAFLAEPKTHVVVGSEAFKDGTGARVVNRLKDRSARYRRIEAEITEPAAPRLAYPGWWKLSRGRSGHWDILDD